MTTLESYIRCFREEARRKIKRIKYPGLRRSEYVHHLDCNPLNNDLDNLVVVPIGFHTHLHSVIASHWGPKKSGVHRETLKRLMAKLKADLIRYNHFLDLGFPPLG